MKKLLIYMFYYVIDNVVNPMTKQQGSKAVGKQPVK